MQIGHTLTNILYVGQRMDSKRLSSTYFTWSIFKYFVQYFSNFILHLKKSTILAQFSVSVPPESIKGFLTKRSKVF